MKSDSVNVVIPHGGASCLLIYAVKKTIHEGWEGARDGFAVELAETTDTYVFHTFPDSSLGHTYKNPLFAGNVRLVAATQSRTFPVNLWSHPYAHQNPSSTSDSVANTLAYPRRFAKNATMCLHKNPGSETY